MNNIIIPMKVAQTPNIAPRNSYLPWDVKIKIKPILIKINEMTNNGDNNLLNFMF